jgi:beta-glucosidase
VDGVTVTRGCDQHGRVAGKEIVQVYVHDRSASLPRPPKELKGFAKVELQPGETKTVTIPLDFRAFAFYHPGYKQWITEDGEFDLLIGASAADIRVFAPLFQQMMGMLDATFGVEPTAEAFGDDAMGYLMNMPLRDVLDFPGVTLSASADEIVDGLLAQIYG